MIRRSSKRPYAAISNELLRDKRLSIAARGLMAMILSYPDDWNLTKKHLMAESGLKDRAFRDRVKELTEGGYLVIEPLRSDGGEFRGKRYIAHDKPTEAADSAGSVIDPPKRRLTDLPLDAASSTTKPERTTKGRTTSSLAEEAKPERERDLIFDALAALDGYDGDVPRNKGALYGKLVRDLWEERYAEVGVDLSIAEREEGLATYKKLGWTRDLLVQEVARRAALWPEIFPGATRTAAAVVKHWRRLGATRAGREEFAAYDR